MAHDLLYKEAEDMMKKTPVRCTGRANTKW